MAPTSSSSVPKLRPGATPAERQAHALAKLLADPSKPVHIPAPPADLGGATKQLRAPREMMKNVQGSSAGAGSGEFHVYKQSRRREFERLKIMDEEEAFLEARLSAEQRQSESARLAEEKTAKNRLKRQRKKAGRKGKKGAAEGEGSEDEEPAQKEEGEGKKRKLGGGAGFKFMSKEEREAEAEEEEAGPQALEEETEQKEREAAEQEQEQVKAAKEAGIMIRDED